MLPQLRELERVFGDALTVIGVHSAKFPAEGDLANLRAALQRLGLHHPVVNDADHAVWEQYAVRAWPTLMVVDGRGRVVARQEGEFALPSLRDLIAESIARAGDAVAGERVPLALAPLPPGGNGLRFPGKVLADERGGRLFVADSGHNRVLVADFEGRVTAAFGSGAAALVDGAADAAAFSHPQGLALDGAGETLYVADAGNHALRAVSLVRGRVDTVAGTGERGFKRSGAGPGRETALASPWDLTRVGRALWIAMAGLHQLWTFEPETGRVAIVAGSGAEALHDGPLAEAAFAQPSGIAALGGLLYVADSETSAVRRIDPAADRVRRLLGRGLFAFGDVGGVGDEVRLQHPLGVAAATEALGDAVYIADSYNHKLKRLDPALRRVETVAGGERGHEDGDLASARFWEPSGLSLAGRRLYVADTNNHAVRVVDLAAGVVTTLPVRAP